MYLEMTKCHIPFPVTVTLTNDLVLIIIVFEAYWLYSLRYGFQIWFVYASWDGGSVTYHFRVTVTLTSDLVLIIIVSGAYLLYYSR